MNQTCVKTSVGSSHMVAVLLQATGPAPTLWTLATLGSVASHWQRCWLQWRQVQEPGSRANRTIEIIACSWESVVFRKQLWVQCVKSPPGRGGGSNLAQDDGLVTTLATSIAVADARTKARISYAPGGTIASIACSSESVVFQRTTSAKTTNNLLMWGSIHPSIPPPHTSTRNITK
jgi:hypothetical protein